MARKKRKAKDSPEMPMVDDKWQAEDDLRTIQRAHEIIGDKGRLTKAQAHAKKQRESLDRIGRLEGKKL